MDMNMGNNNNNTDSFSTQDWLAFSLSNLPSSSSSPHLCLFEAFIPCTTAADVPAEEDEGPRLEDFLGGSSTIAASFLRGLASENKQQAVQPAPRKAAADSFGQRTSIYRGVTRHRWTGRYEAHLWDNSCRREGQSRKGRQGGYDKEDKAARAYDLAALKYWGPATTTNFPISNYEKELEEMKNMTRQEFVASLRRKSSGFSRGASIYRGVTRHHQHGRWQARIGRVAGNKDLYLGTFSTQEEAAEAYDIAAIKFRGLNAVTNFDMCRYDVKSIANTFAVTFESHPSAAAGSNLCGFAVPIKQDQSDYQSNIFGYNNGTTKTPSATVAPTSMLQCPTPTGYDMDFGVNSDSINNGDGYNVSTWIPFATPIVVNNSNNINNYEGSTGYHSWNNSQPLHSYQTAKPSLSVLQTPIFGME
ncbi:hypothetical protein GQ457_12G025500 [Hibiscus cannabinus]